MQEGDEGADVTAEEKVAVTVEAQKEKAKRLKREEGYGEKEALEELRKKREA